MRLGSRYLRIRSKRSFETMLRSFAIILRGNGRLRIGFKQGSDLTVKIFTLENLSSTEDMAREWVNDKTRGDVQVAQLGDGGD